VNGSLHKKHFVASVSLTQSTMEFRLEIVRDGGLGAPSGTSAISLRRSNVHYAYDA
jgi:hypothetical protein